MKSERQRTLRTLPEREHQVTVAEISMQAQKTIQGGGWWGEGGQQTRRFGDGPIY